MKPGFHQACNYSWVLRLSELLLGFGHRFHIGFSHSGETPLTGSTRRIPLRKHAPQNGAQHIFHFFGKWSPDWKMKRPQTEPTTSHVALIRKATSWLKNVAPPYRYLYKTLRSRFAVAYIHLRFEHANRYARLFACVSLKLSTSQLYLCMFWVSMHAEILGRHHHIINTKIALHQNPQTTAHVRADSTKLSCKNAWQIIWQEEAHV